MLSFVKHKIYCSMKIVYWLIRLFFWVFSGFGFFERRIDFIGGNSTLHPFAPYSFLGIPRKDFLHFEKEIKQGEKLGSQLITLSIYGEFCSEISRENFLKIEERKQLMYRYFSSPWRKHRYI